MHYLHSDILKIDVEGSEYTAFDSFMDDFESSKVLPVGQVMIELHLMDDTNVNFKRFMAWWERLESFGMRPTWVETNLIAVTLSVGDADPRCTEVCARVIHRLFPKRVVMLTRLIVRLGQRQGPQEYPPRGVMTRLRRFMRTYLPHTVPFQKIGIHH